ncbi:MAG TPA: nucleotidyl transferase AbiEii/AbiGii toxin family protein [Thermoanaerobaculia bacterium]|nr:nucleotidyl transferase AbiEii/AbiGii toxin family protein [Thermoanaerobaculia bacterium]
MPRSRPNTRVRDLPDIALLATAGEINEAELRLALEQTFRFRGTHSLSTSVPAPPAFWEGPYAAMAATDELIWRTLADVTEAASSFLNPVLGHTPEGRIWVPADWCWRTRP